MTRRERQTIRAQNRAVQERLRRFPCPIRAFEKLHPPDRSTGRFVCKAAT